VTDGRVRTVSTWWDVCIPADEMVRLIEADSSEVNGDWALRNRCLIYYRIYS
jgi:hypothetical protein